MQEKIPFKQLERSVFSKIHFFHELEQIKQLNGSYHPRIVAIASYPGSSLTEKGKESPEDLITCPVTYYAWFYVWF